MKIRMRYYHDVVILSAHGRLTTSTAPLLRQAIEEQLGNGRVHIVADLRDLTTIDQTGTALLMGAMHESRQNGGDLRLAAIRPRVKAVLQAGDGKQAFQIYPNVVAATASYFPWPVSSGEEEE